MNDASPSIEQTASRNKGHGMLGIAGTILIAVYLVGLLCYLRLTPDGLFERDGYFHARYAHLLPERGLSRTFGWTQASTWNGQFCDKEFLYHVSMVPFARQDEDPLRGVRFHSILMSLGLFLALYGVLRSCDVPWPALFAFLPACMGGAYLLRALMIRSHTLSMILALLGMYLLFRKKYWSLCILGFVYAWSYTFPFVLLMFAVPFAFGRWLGGGGWNWKSVLMPGAGVLAGLIIHPYAPLTLETFFTYIQVLSIGVDASATKLELGNEIYAHSTRTALFLLPLYHAILFGLLIAGWRHGKKAAPETLAALCVAVFWYVMIMVYSRFIEYGAPMLVLAFGLVARDVVSDRPLRALLPKNTFVKIVLPMVAGFAVLAAHASTILMTHDAHQQADVNRFKGAAQWMRENLEPKETVAHLWWEEFPDLFYDGYRQHFLWGLDPTYTARCAYKNYKEGEIAELLEKMRTQQIAIHPGWLADTFDARVLVMGHAPALRFAALTTGKWNPIYVDASSVIFALRGPQGPPPGFQAPLGPSHPPGTFAPRSLKLIQSK